MILRWAVRTAIVSAVVGCSVASGLAGPFTYSAEDIGAVTHAMSTAALIFPQGASHFPFIDQPDRFVDAAVSLIAKMKMAKMP